MYILDTDHLSLVQRNGTEGKQILARLGTLNAPNYCRHHRYLQGTG